MSLGYLLTTVGEFTKAQPYYERALTIRERVSGTEHLDTALSLNNLAYLLASQGNYSVALEDYERALAIRERVLGTEHPETLWVLEPVVPEQPLSAAQEADWAASEAVLDKVPDVKSESVPGEAPGKEQ